MGIYLNPKNENFKSVLRADIYVDKTMMLSVLNSFIDKDNKYICISRPRRFGKTIAGNMVAAYYSKGCDSKELFDGLKISKEQGFEEKLNKYNVIQLDMNSEYQNVEIKENMIKNISRKVKEEIRKQFPDISFDESESLAERMLRVYSEIGETFIVIMDEYDVLVREEVPKELFDEYLGFLNGLFKSNALKPAISLAYLTGILPIVRDKVQSKLNNFEEYTILDAKELTPYVGFITDEVKNLCEKNGMDFEKCKQWYDGYRLGGEEIYNPESVVKSMIYHKFGNYWGKTSSYAVITDQINRNFAGIREAVISMLAGEAVPFDCFMFLNTMDSFKTKDDILTYLCHVGYLAYDEEKEASFIPNGEIRREWERAVSISDDYEITDKIIKDSKELLQKTLEGDEKAVASALDISHIHVTSNRSYNNEDALQSAIYLAYIYARNKYYVFKELTTGKGFADVVFVPFTDDLPAMIIELKHNKTSETALTQIKNKQYFASLSDYKGEILFVGINYDEKEKTHGCKIEKFTKSIRGTKKF